MMLKFNFIADQLLISPSSSIGSMCAGVPVRWASCFISHFAVLIIRSRNVVVYAYDQTAVRCRASWTLEIRHSTLPFMISQRTQSMLLCMYLLPHFVRGYSSLSKSSHWPVCVRFSHLKTVVFDNISLCIACFVFLQRPTVFFAHSCIFSDIETTRRSSVVPLRGHLLSPQFAELARSCFGVYRQGLCSSQHFIPHQERRNRYFLGSLLQLAY
ncbi:hypothetical protein BDR03DRAFT_953821 [Suillus americanus]|nr:hypothetical protein BDR03DRAFT_953821 [Suillus americanus]